MEITYQIFEAEKLLVQKYSGPLDFQKYVRFTQHLSKYFNSIKVNSVIIDFRHVYFDGESEQFSANIDRMIALRKKIHEAEPKVRDSRAVFWVDKPMPTAVAQMVTRSYSPTSFTFCSTAREILRITNLPESFADLENIVSNLENTFH